MGYESNGRPRSRLDFGPEYDRERDEDMIEDCTVAIDLSPSDPRPYLERADARSRLGLYEEAVADYGCAIRLDPDNAAAYLGRFWALGELGRDEEALIDYDRAVSLDPNIAADILEQ